MDKQIQEAVRVFKNGGIVIFPTDTAIGIGCRIDNPNAVKRLFKIRKRPLTQPTPVLVSSFEMAQDYLLPIDKDVVDQLISKYWPGALTLILQCIKEKVPELVRGGSSTLGVRMPNHAIILSLIKKLGIPILGPSANFHGKKTPYDLKDLDPMLLKLVDYVVGGECLLKKQSTIIDCSTKPWKILREGAIKIQNVVLLMDTADNKKITVGLKINDKEYIHSEKITSNKTQIILPMIDKILKKHSLKPEDLSEIQINPGPGSFTGLRIGLAIANALSFVLKIPVNEKKVGEIILPIYK